MTPNNLKTIDLSPAPADFLADALRGLSQPQKSLEPKYFYDAKGSSLFNEICLLPEYYVTRTELGVMATLERFSATTEGLAIIELGGADSFKFRRLLDVVDDINMYIAVDISKEALLESTRKLAVEFPELSVVALCADYEQIDSIDFSELIGGLTPVVFFPGSTIGNLDRKQSLALLKRCRRLVGDGGYMLVGCDMIKSSDILIPAYDDSAGVTALFNLNVLQRLNAELGGDFDLEKFSHRALYNTEFDRIEMHLVSMEDQTVHLAGQSFKFVKGETIHTENSHKFSRDIVNELATGSAFKLSRWWTDPLSHFAIALLYADETLEIQEAACYPDLADYATIDAGEAIIAGVE